MKLAKLRRFSLSLSVAISSLAVLGACGALSASSRPSTVPVLRTASAGQSPRATFWGFAPASVTPSAEPSFWGFSPSTSAPPPEPTFWGFSQASVAHSDRPTFWGSTIAPAEPDARAEQSMRAQQASPAQR